MPYADPDVRRRAARLRMRKWRERNPNHPRKRKPEPYISTPETRQRTAAREMAHRAIKRGDLIPQACECGRGPYDEGRRVVHAHHDDYSRPLVVRWLCPPCHGALRRIED